MNRSAIVACVLSCMAFARAMAAEPDKPTLSVARITSSLEEGQKWGFALYGFVLFKGCVEAGANTPLLWGKDPGRLNVRALEQPARDELKKQGFKIAGDTTDPFTEKGGGDFALGATITSVKSGFCFAGPRSKPDMIMGFTSMDIDWQIYSTAERQVVAKVHTVGDQKIPRFVRTGFETLMFGALDDSLQKLTTSPEFQQAVAKRPHAPTHAEPDAPKATLVLAGSRTAQPTKIADAVGAVVLILSGGGHGSGFLVSTDGYLMTAEHVVGSDKYVKVRWSDGLEGVGEVVRTDKRRDVALIKTDPRNRQPLALRRDSPQPGDTVFAIGAPIDPKLQNTVTRGVVSASNRIMDGFSFIQSDVTVDPGNSGGPLLDEQGRVLGFTDKGIRTAEAPTGLNFFVPIDDALRFLSAEPQ
jgi:serine protease Do